ncbi:MAG: hypothetical protein ACRCXZ_09240 [Patescibacteria group bacterium]
MVSDSISFYAHVNPSEKGVSVIFWNISEDHSLNMEIKDVPLNIFDKNVVTAAQVANFIAFIERWDELDNKLFQMDDHETQFTIKHSDLETYIAELVGKKIYRIPQPVKRVAKVATHNQPVATVHPAFVRGPKPCSKAK